MLGIQLVFKSTGLTIFTGLLMSTPFFWDVVLFQLVSKDIPSSNARTLQAIPAKCHVHSLHCCTNKSKIVCGDFLSRWYVTVSPARKKIAVN